MSSITIIISAYNAAKTIERCVNSLLKQDIGVDYKILIFNDGSTDTTWDVLQKYKDNHYVQLINKGNSGASETRNQGLDLVDSEYVTFVDSDDYVDSNYLKVLISQYQKNSNIYLAICGYQKELPDGTTLMVGTGSNTILNRKQALHDILISYGFEGYLVNKLFKFSIIKEYELRFDKNLRISEDLLFCTEYLMHCKKISYDPTPVYHYIRYENSQLHSNQIGAKYTGNGLNALSTFDRLNEVVPMNYIDYHQEVNARICWIAVTQLRAIEAAPNRKKVDKNTYGMLRELALKYRSDFMKNTVLPKRDKIIYWINWFFPRTLGFLWRKLKLQDHS